MNEGGITTYEFIGTDKNQWGTINLREVVMSSKYVDFQLSTLIPARTGINKFNKDSTGIIIGLYFLSSGNFEKNPSYRITHYITCKDENFVSIYSGASNNAIVFYDINFIELSVVYSSNTVKLEGIEIPNGAIYLRFHYYEKSESKVMCQFSNKLSSFVHYTPLYKMVDSYTVDDNGLNATNLRKDTLTNLLLNTNNVITNIFDASSTTDYGDADILNSGYISVYKGGTYATNIKFHLGGAKYLKVFDRYYNEIGDFIISAGGKAIIIPEISGISYIYFRYYATEGAYIINREQYYDNEIPYGEFYTTDKTLLNQFVNLVNLTTKDNTLCFETSKNLIDQDKFKLGIAFETVNTGYNTTDFIYVSHIIGKTIYYSNNGIGKDMRQFFFYDSNKKVVGSIYDNLHSIKVPDGVTYFRQAVAVNDKFPQLEIDRVTPYRKYGPILKEEALPNSIPIESFSAFLPDTLYVGKDSIIEIYNIQIAKCGNLNNFHFYWKGNIITTPQYPNKVRIDPKGKQPGIYYVELEVTNNDNESVYFKKITVVLISNLVSAINTPYTIIPFGDSGVNKAWLPETRNLLQKTTGYDTLHWIGSQEYYNKSIDGAQYCNNIGKSGWVQSQFLNAGSYKNIKFKISSVISITPVFNKTYEVTLTNNTKILYKIDEVLEEGGITYLTMSVVTYSSILATIGPLNSGTLKSTDSLSGDSIISYESFENIGGNPFWNPTTNTVDFSYFFSHYSIPEPDAFLMHLGGNDKTDTASIEQLIDVIQSQMPNKRIYVNSIWMFEDISFNIKRRIEFLKFVETIYEICKRKNNVYFIPIYATIDAEHNFGWIEENINPRNSHYKLMRPNEIIHYQEAGYYQLADTVYSTLLATISI